MIKINLLPPEFQVRKGRVKGPPAAPGARAGIAIVIAWGIIAGVCVLYTVHFTWSAYARSRDGEADWKRVLDRRQAEYERKRASSEEMWNKWERMQTQQEILAQLMPAERLLWSEKLNMLARMMPQGVLITELRVDERTEKVETQASIDKRQEYEDRKQAKEEDIGEPPEAVMKPVITQILTIKAAAIGEDNDQRMDRMLEFEKALSTYAMTNHRGEVRRFMSGFKEDVALGDMMEEELDGVTIWAFRFKLTTKPFDPEREQ